MPPDRPARHLINTEQPNGSSWRFRLFLAARHVPGLAAGLGWVAAQPRVRRHRFVSGGAFADSSRLDGEFFLRPLHDVPERRAAAVRVLRSFDYQLVRDLADVHRRIEVPVQLVWGDRDPFFPIEHAEAMVATFPHAQLATVRGAGLFSHEEKPAEVAQALLAVLTGG